MARVHDTLDAAYAAVTDAKSKWKGAGNALRRAHVDDGLIDDVIADLATIMDAIENASGDVETAIEEAASEN